MNTPLAFVSSQTMQDAHREEVETTASIMADELKPYLSNSPKPGTKRLFSNRGSKVGTDLPSDAKLPHEVDSLSLSAADSHEDSESSEDIGSCRQWGDKDGQNGSVEKRHRTSDWPLKNRTDGQGILYALRDEPRGRHGPSNVAVSHQRTVSLPRPSKFIEGSMNDRISHKPQQLYIGDQEELLNRSETRDLTEDNDEGETQLDGSAALATGGHKSEAHRQSTIFRFGKSLAAAFNPSSWKIWPKTRDEEDKPSQKLWDERRDKAGKAYKELKRTEQLEQPINYSKGEFRIKHDSGVEFQSRQSTNGAVSHKLSKTLRTPANEKRYGRVFLDPPYETSLDRSERLSYDSVGAPSNSSFPVRAPLMQTNGLENRPQVVRRLPSRKDLQKQQKLVKRVSDLEGKLEAARRQLAEALGEPIPNQDPGFNRQRFIPGALASLPSEGLLSAYAHPSSKTGDSREVNGVGIALSTEDGAPRPNTSGYGGESDVHSPFYASTANIDGWSLHTNLADSEMLSVTQASQQAKLLHGEAVQEDLVDHTPRNVEGQSNTVLESPKQQGRKRKSIGLGNTDDSGTYQAPPESEGDDSYEAPKPSPPKRKPGRPRKLKKADPDLRSRKSEVGSLDKSRAGLDKSSPKPSRGRTRQASASRRAPSSRKTNLAAIQTRIPRKGRLSASPPPPSSSVVNKIVEENDRQVIPTGARISKAEPTGVPNGQVNAEGFGGVLVHAGDDVGTGKPATARDPSQADEKQSFEWPEDVF